MKIGLVAMSAKPYHAGHDKLIRLAAENCDSVTVFVSITDRIRKNEFPIQGSKMLLIWKKFIAHSLPNNVSVEYGGSPVRNIYEILGKANEKYENDKNDVSINSYVVYSDPKDLLSNFPVKSRQKYLNLLYASKKVDFLAIERANTVNISGTEMRLFLADKNRDDFVKNLPESFSYDTKLEIWNLLA